MKKAITLIAFFCTISAAGFADKLDSLRSQLKLITNDSLKAPLYADLAQIYMGFDTVSNPVKKMVYQNEAIVNSFQALHLYSKYTDTLGMRTCFNNLATVYYKQKQYSPAKWYALQSINLSRCKKDAPQIASALLTLAAIKTEVKDYKLARKDVKEALYWASLCNDENDKKRLTLSGKALYKRLGETTVIKAKQRKA